MASGDKGGAAANPFIDKKVTCPVCQAVSRQRRLRARMFIEQTPDVDLRPTNIVRHGQGLEAYHPLCYYIWRCPQCNYAAAHSEFEDPSKGTGLKLERVVNRLNEAQEEADSVTVISTLGQGLAGDPVSFEQAARKFLLAIYHLQQVPEIAERDAAPLARYCLRLSWLFPYAQEGPDGGENFAQSYLLLMRRLNSIWKMAPINQDTALKMAAYYYQIAHKNSHVVKGEAEAVQVLLAIARIYLKLEEQEKAQRFFSMALNIAKKFDAQAKSLGGRSAGAASDADEVHKQAATTATLARKLLNQVKEVAELIYDARAGGEGKPDLGISEEIVIEFGKTKKKKKKKGILSIFGG